MGLIHEDAFTSETFLVNVHDGKFAVQVFVCWKLSGPAADVDGPQYFRCLDLIMTIVPSSPICRDIHDEYLVPPYADDSTLKTLVDRCYVPQASTKETQVALKVILVPHAGFMCRDDIFELRMRHSEYVDSIIPFSTSDSHLVPISHHGQRTLLTLLPSSPGAILAKPSQRSHIETLKLLERDIEVRLSFDWILPIRPVGRTVAVVGGRPPLDLKRGSYASQGPFEAAKALGMSIIVLDRSEHWLNTEMYSHLRDDFIAINMADDESLPFEIVNALKGRKVDGIITFSDDYVIATARAAEILDLPAEPLKAILKAHHKDEMRKAICNPTIDSLQLIDSKQMDEPSMNEIIRNLRYPLIVKPSRGAGSRGVRKVNDHLTLRQAVRQLEADGMSQYGILVESYIDGPEIDANFALWDGELIFCEISDDFPCKGDGTDASINDNFAETVIVSPSRLDSREIEMLRSSLYRNLLHLGFRSGIFHVEARVKNSSMSYEKVDGILDLADIEIDVSTELQPEAFLIEVNARPPGIQAVYSTLYTYGVDMCALQLLHAVGDRQRYLALSKPFTTMTQYWCANCQIPVHREKVQVPEDLFQEVIRQLPDIALYVSRAELLTQPGRIVSPRGGSWFFGYFLLYSRTSRRHTLEMCERVLDMNKIVVDDYADR